MDVNTFTIYLHELRNQCLYTQAALTVFNQSLEQKSANGALFAAQAALTSASQAASILWPPRARAKRRGETLREKLKLPDNHAMADRRFVELWERADEKLDDFVKATKGEQVLFDFVGSAKSLQIPNLKEDGVYRLYDTDTKVFVFRGVGYNLENLAKAITEIGRRAELLIQQLMPQRTPEGGAQPKPDPQSGDADAVSPAPAETVAESDLPSPTTEAGAGAAKTAAADPSSTAR